MKVPLPFHAENVRKLTFFDPAGEILYTTNYRVIDNMLEEVVSFKYLITKEQKFAQFEIVGKSGQEGSFCTLQKGMFDRKLSIYVDEVQIAQSTKPLTMTDNLDIYFLHIKDEHVSMIPILSFFTVYYDYRKYNNGGELRKNSVEIAVSYSYDKNNNKYNPGWIEQEFGRQALEEFEQTLRKIREQGSAQTKRILKVVGAVFMIRIILAVILFIILQCV